MLVAFTDPAGARHDAAGVVALLREQDTALLRVGERLVVDGRAFCAESGRSAGMTVQRLAQYGADYRPAARTQFGIGDRPTVAVVAAGGAAEQAGLRPGDRIVAIDGHAFADTPPTSAGGNFATTAAALDVIDAALADGRAELTIERGSVHSSVVLLPRPACRARFDVRAGRSNNASSDGLTLQVSSDLLAEVHGDGELAAILAHELAHNILHHPQRLKGPKPRPSVRATEIEADRLSVYLLDAAGYPAADAVAFWARWGRANDLGIFADRSHPGWKQRIEAIEQEVAAIAAQHAAGHPVVAPADLRPR